MLAPDDGRHSFASETTSSITGVARSLDTLDHALAEALAAAENGSIGDADEIAGLLGRLSGPEESGDPHIQMPTEETREVADALVAASPSRAAD